ncbi:hypothetical protein PHYSODRAFT_477411 [Phytophthora sojae]|uniref:C3H1-type domain-containing protein n=1 Tax=Phytophthora sojae (strain P6497) TaxID=1094619 RepID=G4YKK8_PHYSP|nr:hypothetical protein PHYSODRAFT_477411 [Phytophthora sojae]EGZ28840.1 hypothetical protein PHYSODRAFT_477411 [Phytophthora sojae]|eukprot:XP_009516115.1 hypothetical protein PHYSODRAFT_477411 [Phytophthora sojae]
MLRSTAPSSFLSTSVSVAICALGSSPMMDLRPTSSCSSRRHSSCCRSWSDTCCATRASRDSGREEAMEEATLRAKIQAMKNLLEVKRQRAGPSPPPTYPTHRHAHYAPTRRYARATPSGPVNRSWNRFPPPSTSPSPSHVGGASANKVWRREDAASAATSPPAGAAVRSSTPPSAPLGANKTKSMQLQMLRLEDGEYSKANGGSSLVRAGVKKPTVVWMVVVADICVIVCGTAGYCKNKDACRFIHDSRRVAMCRKFLKNECSDPKCLLSHQHDEVERPTDFRFAHARSRLSALLRA